MTDIALRRWAIAEIKLARDKLNMPIDSRTQLLDNASLNGRIGALKDVLRMEKRL